MEINREKEYLIKKQRILKLLEKNDAYAAVISRQDNFSWLTGGGANSVVLNSEYGVGFIVITKEKEYFVANSMDAQRISDEELLFGDYEIISLKWYEIPPMEMVLKIIGDKSFICDTDIKNGKMLLNEIYKIHYPLTKNEIKKYKEIAREAEEILCEVAFKIRPGITENDVKALLLQEYAKKGMFASVIIIGSDERIAKYRHCMTNR